MSEINKWKVRNDENLFKQETPLSKYTSKRRKHALTLQMKPKIVQKAMNARILKPLPGTT